MIVIDCKQGSDEWLRARLGIPTASRFDKLLTPGGKPSESARRYMAELLAEWWTGEPAAIPNTPYMERGTHLEPKAIEYYEFVTGHSTSRVGFCLLDDRSAGASPDLLVGDDGLAEFKCLAIVNHVLALIDKAPVREHTLQVQGQMMVTGRRWCDVVFYNPVMPSMIVRVERDDAMIEALTSRLAEFSDELRRSKAILDAHRPARQPDDDTLPACLA